MPDEDPKKTARYVIHLLSMVQVEANRAACGVRQIGLDDLAEALEETRRHADEDIAEIKERLPYERGTFQSQEFDSIDPRPNGGSNGVVRE